MFNSHGFITKIISDDTEEYKYNKYFDPIEVTKGIDTYTFSYEYDKKKNWTKRITYKNDDPIFIEIRELSYYE